MEKETTTNNETIVNVTSEESNARSLSRELFEKQNGSLGRQSASTIPPHQRFQPLLEKFNFEEKPSPQVLVSEDEHPDSLKGLKRQLDYLQIQMTEFIKATQFKMERMSKTVKTMEQIQVHQRQEIARNYAELSGKVKERKITENKISDLVDRHNQIVNDFENRLGQLKKSLNERELKFLQMASALEDAQREIERLKRL